MLPYFLHLVCLHAIVQLVQFINSVNASALINALLALFPYLIAHHAYLHFIFFSTHVFLFAQLDTFPTLSIIHAQNVQHYVQLVPSVNACPASQLISSFLMAHALSFVLHRISSLLLLMSRHVALVLKAAKFARMALTVIHVTLLSILKKIRHKNCV